MRLTSEKIRKIYNEIKYKATDGEIYRLNQIFPICLAVKDSKDTVCLDTGGQMEDCDFFVAKIENNNLYRKDDLTSEWNKIASLVKDSLKVEEDK